MRRVLAFVAFVLVVLGLELSTQTFSLTISRLAAGISAVRSGVELDVPAGRFIMGLVFIVLGLALFGLLVWAGHAIARRECETCGWIGLALRD